MKKIPYIIPLVFCRWPALFVVPPRVLQSAERGELRAEAAAGGGEPQNPDAPLAGCHCSRMARDHDGHAAVRAHVRREHQERKGGFRSRQRHENTGLPTSF